MPFISLHVLAPFAIYAKHVLMQKPIIIIYILIKEISLKLHISNVMQNLALTVSHVFQTHGKTSHAKVRKFRQTPRDLLGETCKTRTWCYVTTLIQQSFRVDNLHRADDHLKSAVCPDKLKGH